MSTTHVTPQITFGLTRKHQNSTYQEADNPLSTVENTSSLSNSPHFLQLDQFDVHVDEPSPQKKSPPATRAALQIMRASETVSKLTKK